MSAAALTGRDVLAAADALVKAFSETDGEAYFASFSPEATFVFHTESRPLITKAAYEIEWAAWVSSGWSVAGVESAERRVDIHGPVAVFTHVVRTTTSVRTDSGAELQTIDERETILFARQADGSLLAVHEHLSAVPLDEITAVNDD